MERDTAVDYVSHFSLCDSAWHCGAFFMAFIRTAFVIPLLPFQSEIKAWFGLERTFKDRLVQLPYHGGDC